MHEANISFPTIQTERLLLREISYDDVPDLFKIRSNKTAMEFIDRPIAKTEEEVINLIEIIKTNQANGEGITWAITLKDEDKLIGTMGYWRYEKKNARAEIGYVLHPDFFNKRICTEALQPIIDYGFKKMNLHSIEANVLAENTASIKLLLKYAFQLEAHFKENIFTDGKYTDSLVYSLINPAH